MAISEVFLTRKRYNVRSGYLSNVQESAQRWRLVPAASHGRDSPSTLAKLTAAHIRECTKPIVYPASRARLAFDG
jgi:hypothetical protein